MEGKTAEELCWGAEVGAVRRDQVRIRSELINNKIMETANNWVFHRDREMTQMLVALQIKRLHRMLLHSLF
uniref:Uncharacterized protein n=1 Tax=Arundo donax TaxID=35708 RepID=A0A0A9GJ93_ARUDO